jgi:lipopolysaccharide export system protein LptA
MYLVTERSQGRVEAGSNTSTVTLRVVGGDGKGSLESETVKYGRESKGTRTRERLTGEGQQHIQKTDPSSRQRGRPTKTRL